MKFGWIWTDYVRLRTAGNQISVERIGRAKAVRLDFDATWGSQHQSECATP